MTGDRFDVVVVGASLAGSATATLLGRAGLRVALVDKHSGADAYKRLCGHYIQGSARPVIERLGLANAIEAAGGVRNGVDIWTRWGVIGRPGPAGKQPFGYSVRRATLDPLIRGLAIETPGVEYLPGHEAVGLLGDGRAVSGVELRDRSGGTSRIGSQIVIGADGRNSKVARLAGARERPAGNKRFCYMAYFTGVVLPQPKGRLWALDPDVAIASPNDCDHTILAAFLHKRRLPEFQGDRTRALRNLFARLPEPPGLERAELAGKVVGYKDYGIVARDPNPRPGLALVGDAVQACDPVMAIGCGFALQSAEWLADDVGPALGEGRTADAALRRYRRTHRRRLGPHHRMLAAEARAHAMNPLQRMLFAAAARDPQTATTVHRYAERSIPPRRLLSPRTLARAARVNASARIRNPSQTRGGTNDEP